MNKKTRLKWSAAGSVAKLWLRGCGRAAAFCRMVPLAAVALLSAAAWGGHSDLGSVAGSKAISGTITTADYSSSSGTSRYIDTYTFTAASSGTMSISGWKHTGTVYLQVITINDEKFTYNSATYSGNVSSGYMYTIMVYNYTGSGQTYSFTLNTPGKSVAKPNLAFTRCGTAKSWPASVFLGATSSTTTKSTTFDAGASVYLYACFINSGSAATGKGYKILHEVINSSSKVVATSTTSEESLAAGVSRLFNGAAISPLQGLSAGSYTYRCTLDSGKVVSESNESDNVATYQFTVKAATRYIVVTWDANGGELSDGVETSGGSYDASKAIGTLATPKRDNYTFLGWFTDAIGGTQVTASTKLSSVVSATATSIRIYAHWREKVVAKPDLSITSFKVKGLTDATLEAGQSYQFQFTVKNQGTAASVATKAGINVSSGTKTGSVKRDITYWIVVDVPKIAAGSSVNLYSTTFEAAEYWTRYDPSFELTVDYSDAVDESNEENNVAKLDFTVIEPVTYVVTFDPCGGTCESSQKTVRQGQQVGTLPVPTLPRYEFAGWFTKASGGTKVTSKTVVTGDVTWYAQWTYTGQATVSAQVGAGCEELGTVTGGLVVKAGTKLTLKATAKRGAVFAGWYYDEECDVPVDDLGVDYRSTSLSVVGSGEDVSFYALFIPTEEDYVDISLDEDSMEYSCGESIEAIVLSIESGSLPTVKVTGLPTGLKFDAKSSTVSGTPTRSGIYLATVKATTLGKATATATLKMIVRKEGDAILDVEFDASMGTVSGTGICADGKNTTLKATAKRGYVFAGWYYDDECAIPVDDLGVDYRSTSLPVVGNGEDVLYYASFVSAEEDAEIAINVDDAYDVNGTCEIPISIGSYSFPTVSANGLPAGLKFDAKKLLIYGTPTKPGVYTVKLSVKNATVKKAIVQTFVICVANIESPYLDIDYATDAYVYQGGVAVDFDIGSCAQDGYSVSGISGLPSGLKFNAKTGLIEGVPSKAGAYTVTVTLKNGKSKSSATLTMNVMAIDTWAYGTFNGGSEYGQAQMTISSVGKLSGKFMSEGVTYTLSSPSFTTYEDGVYSAVVTVSWSYKENGKTIKSSDSMELEVVEGDAGGKASCDLFSANQNLWSSRDWKTRGTEVFGKSGKVLVLSDENADLTAGETVTVTIKANGTVTCKGVFNTSQTDSKGREIFYTTSGSAVVCVEGLDPFDGCVYVYFPPNEKKGFAGWTTIVSVGAD